MYDSKMNLSPEAQKYFSEKFPGRLYVDPKENVWERTVDPWHPDAFRGCGLAVESVMCTPERREAAGPRKVCWALLDFWGNAVGHSFEDPPGYVETQGDA